MKHSALVFAGALTSLALFLPGCAGVSQLFIKQSDAGLSKVDGLLEKIERAHVEAVVSRDRLHESLEALQVLVSPDFGGDALQSFARFDDAVERSEAQVRELSAAVEPMKRTAQQVFDTWSLDLKSYADSKLAQRSRQRLDENHDSYNAILRSLTPAQKGFGDLTAVLRDMALFLRHDFNASAVAEIRDQVGQLAQRALDVDAGFRESQEAALAYVRENALRGQVLLSRTEAAPIGPISPPALEPAVLEETQPSGEPEPATEAGLEEDPAEPVFGPEPPPSASARDVSGV